MITPNDRDFSAAVRAYTRSYDGVGPDTFFKAPPVYTGFWTVSSWVAFIDWSLPGNQWALLAAAHDLALAEEAERAARG